MTDLFSTETIAPTEDDGDWVAQALTGVAPLESISNDWIFEGVKDHEGASVNKYREKGSSLIVLVAINPVRVKGNSEKKKVSYHVTVCREKDGKIKKPNEADISRARRTFFLRDLNNEERVHEGVIGDSRAHHIVALIDLGGPKIAKPGGGFF
tara:strand:- start:2986 stop:3444 length:459 start_codon:yes stop_codon:yes gene_type:complete